MLQDARRDDIDPVAIATYRRDRARIKPQAEALDDGDDEMREALGMLRRVDGRLLPTLAGIVLFGKNLALRRLLPAACIALTAGFIAQIPGFNGTGALPPVDVR